MTIEPWRLPILSFIFRSLCLLLVFDFCHFYSRAGERKDWREHATTLFFVSKLCQFDVTERRRVFSLLFFQHTSIEAQRRANVNWPCCTSCLFLLLLLLSRSLFFALIKPKWSSSKYTPLRFFFFSLRNLVSSQVDGRNKRNSAEWRCDKKALQINFHRTRKTSIQFNLQFQIFSSDKTQSDFSIYLGKSI